jgi:hypothetical protein
MAKQQRSTNFAQESTRPITQVALYARVSTLALQNALIERGMGTFKNIDFSVVRKPSQKWALRTRISATARFDNRRAQA